MLVEAYGGNALSRSQCYRWFEKFQDGDFDNNSTRTVNRKTKKIVCKMLLARYKRKSYLHHIVIGDEKWICFENPKHNRSYVDPRQASKSTARPNRFSRKTMLCIFWDQEGPIYYELLKPGETVNTDRYMQQLLNL
ncbi:mariner Mos1 transposase [Trichonephila clavipes]|nr:mariner Mos1 transposase [Trichonephila clavipes]